MRSQNKAILQDLLRGKKLTGLDAVKSYGVGYLPARIKNIRDLGVNVHDVRIKVIGMHGKSKPVKQYFIPKDERSQYRNILNGM